MNWTTIEPAIVQIIHSLFSILFPLKLQSSETENFYKSQMVINSQNAEIIAAQ
jgi:hypothetical protein